MQHQCDQEGAGHRDGPILPEHIVAKRWNKSVRTLQRWRRAGTGPAYLQIGGSVFYRSNDIIAFEDASRRIGGEPA
ncbi:hypothetical protein U879_13635 [Defluviimonas sp. 20V17]|uniref:Helix-turn-helix domain-containing protein n=1 Tax=Allgaiera indica TaxID=765699 RepID=A0AAN4ZYU7_9RHOB|nr:helix-turn-helix domain-containing protein [Allgaiera indica]KDB03164.1 hypothetical protein U879_13635 [Defluviimonas sp. 20V17]GHE00898.1 hypothetical protein GCM10008024_14370 [Allgaiera indica]SDW74085.1 hypothetical protein SAMN05444006_106129 [Allgaiera indica]